jgi:hypothetical protein
MSDNSTGWSHAEADRIVAAAFLALFDRLPDQRAREFYVDHLVHDRLSVETLLRQLTTSAEFAEKCFVFAVTTREPVVEAVLADPSVADLSARLASDPESALAALNAWTADADLPVDIAPGQAAYVVEHRRRFAELLAAAQLLTAGRERPRVLEFGPSAFSSLYERALPGCHLVLCERPAAAESGGFDEACLTGRIRYEALVPVDLLGDLDGPALELDRHGPYDLIVFTEVLEHLARHPVEILAMLVGRLAPGGSLYLTTPNALSSTRLHAIGRRRNPQDVFPRGGNAHAHHHVREYTMSELVEFVQEAGASVTALRYSACWDHAHSASPPPLRGGLVVVAARSGLTA